MNMMKLLIPISAIILSIVVGNRYRINTGIIAGSLATVIGIIMLQMTAADFFSLVPSKIIFTVTVITIFYGYLSENGTLSAVIDYMIYALKGNARMLPVAIFILSILISAIGIGAPTATAILAPIVMSIAPRIRQSSLLLGVSVSYGVCIGGNFILSQGGIIASSIIESSSAFTGMGRNMMFQAFLLSTLFFSSLYVVIYVLSQRKSVPMSGTLEKPAPLSTVQKQSLLLLAVCLITILLFALLSHFLPKGPLQFFFTEFDLSFVILIGIFVESALHLAHFPDIVKNHIPTQTLIFFTGMTLLMGVSIRAGIVEWLSSLVQENIPQFFVCAILALFGGIMSCFSSTLSVVIPVLFPLVPSIASKMDLNPVLLYSAIFIGSTGAGISPFSTGGLLLISNCQVREEYHSLWNKFLLLCGINIFAAFSVFLLIGQL